MIAIITIMTMVKPVQATSSDLQINHLDFQVQINVDGSIKVTEKWNIKINDTNTLYKTFQTDKSKYTEITNVEVTDLTEGSNKPLRQTNQWSYHLPQGNYYGGLNQDNQFEIAWGVGLENRTATKVYEIAYLVKDAVAKYNDYAELYWQFVGKDFEIDAKNITGTITLPNHVASKDDIKVWGHTEDLNGEIYATDTNKIEFHLEAFRAGRYVEIRTLFPSQMIENTKRGGNTERLETVIQEETTWANQANNRRKMKETTKQILAITINIGAIILTIFCIKSILKTRKKIKTSKKLKPTFEIQYFREMPREEATPAEALKVLKQQLNGVNHSIWLGNIVSATLLDLSIKKIIDFEVQDKIITIQILKQNSEELEKQKDEKAIFEFLKKAIKNGDGKITMKQLEKYIRKSQTEVLKLGTQIDTFAEQSLYEKELGDKEGNKQKNELTVYIILLAIMIPIMIGIFVMLATFSMMAFGIIPLGIAMIIQLIMYCIQSSKTNVLTKQGIDEQAKWKGLKKYMEDFSMLDKREVPEIVIWEKFLVYATVFGIADKVLKQLKIVYPNLEEQFGRNHYGTMYLMLNTNFSSSFSNAISTSMSTAYSSATGGGGGFSGGGRRSDGGRRWWRRKIKSVFQT